MGNSDTNISVLMSQTRHKNNWAGDSREVGVFPPSHCSNVMFFDFTRRFFIESCLTPLLINVAGEKLWVSFSVF